MPRINLLAWRDELRTHRRNQFYIALGGAAVGAIAVIGISYLIFDSIINHQKSRNNILQEEIEVLNIKIEEIIEQLQRSRPGIVHVFDELVQTLPNGVYLTSVKQTGQRLEIAGSAESNTRVSALMRNIDKSDWLMNPDLEVVEVKESRSGDTGERASEFTVFATQASPENSEEEFE